MIHNQFIRTKPSADLILHQDEVHIWIVDIEKNSTDMKYFRELLSPEESKQADKFIFEKDRFRYTITHGALHILICAYTGVNEKLINYIQGKYRKPGLQVSSWKKLYFNLSHSGNFILYAFSWDLELGIDIEQIRDMQDSDSIIERFCSEKEKAEYFSIQKENRTQAFFKCWTRKEAYIKARGDGLYFPLNNFTVSIKPDTQPALIEVKDEPLENDRWKLHDLKINDLYSSALVADKSKINLTFFKWIR
jgi:4'-phosphopantetheinyl transferase